MKSFRFLILTLFLLYTDALRAQNVDSLIAEGNRQYQAGNYKTSVEIFENALKLAPASIGAQYQLAFSLKAAGRGKEALPYLEAVLRASSQTAVLSSSYGLLGEICDQEGNSQKAVEYYNQAIQLEPGNQSYYYGQGLAYFRGQNYRQAEERAIRSITLNSADAASFRLYGLVTFHQNKRAAAFLALCHFLFLDPRGPFAQEAHNNLQSLLKGGVLKEAPEDRKERADDASTLALNQVLTKTAAQTAKQVYPSKTDLLAAQIGAVSVALSEQILPSGEEEIVFRKLVSLYSQLGRSKHLRTFAFYISQKWDTAAASWIKTHRAETEQMKVFISDRMQHNN